MHPSLHDGLHAAVRADLDRELRVAQRRNEALHHLSARPPSVGRMRRSMAHGLEALARRLAPPEPRRA